MKNVKFEAGERLAGQFVISNRNGITEYVAENDNVIICFRTDAGCGTNYSQVQWVTSKKTGRQYRAWRFLLKWVGITQLFSNQLYAKWHTNNEFELLQAQLELGEFDIDDVEDDLYEV
jgi:hypothetical protein